MSNKVNITFKMITVVDEPEREKPSVQLEYVFNCSVILPCCILYRYKMNSV